MEVSLYWWNVEVEAVKSEAGGDSGVKGGGNEKK